MWMQRGSLPWTSDPDTKLPSVPGTRGGFAGNRVLTVGREASVLPGVSFTRGGQGGTERRLCSPQGE